MRTHEDTISRAVTEKTIVLKYLRSWGGKMIGENETALSGIQLLNFSFYY